MKPVDCIAEDALGEVLLLPAGDPRRAHVESCPRCRALVVSYQGFVEPAAEDAAIYGGAERRRLDETRERMFAGTAPGTGGTAPASRRIVPAPRAPWWSRAFAPALRPAWALAAVAVVVGAVVLWPRPVLRGPEPIVRGTADRPLALTEPAPLRNGGVRLAWRPFPGAQRYEVRFYSTALSALGRFDAGSDTGASLTLGDLPAAYRSRELILYRVAAMLGQDELALSATGSLQQR
jgi:hypothetical protein